MSSILSSSLLILYGVVKYINLFKAQQSIMKKVLKYKDNINEKKHSSILYLKDKFMNIESNFISFIYLLIRSKSGSESGCIFQCGK